MFKFFAAAFFFFLISFSSSDDEDDDVVDEEEDDFRVFRFRFFLRPSDDELDDELEKKHRVEVFCRSRCANEVNSTKSWNPWSNTIF